MTPTLRHPHPSLAIDARKTGMLEWSCMNIVEDLEDLVFEPEPENWIDLIMRLKEVELPTIEA